MKKCLLLVFLLAMFVKDFSYSASVESKKRKGDSKMKILVVYYSRTGTTKKVAETIASDLKCDSEEIIDTKNRSGFWGYLKSGRDAMKKRLTILEPIKKTPDSYDLVIIGTPIWAWNVSAPVRTYIVQNADKFKKVAFFCTMGGSGDVKAFKEMESISGKKPIATLGLRQADVKNDTYKEKVSKFIEEIR